MDATNQVEQPLRSVKRGRPAKVGISTKEVNTFTRQDEEDRKATLAFVEMINSPAQMLALRIWEGQSPDLPVSDRIARIHAALTAQGMDTNVTLP